MDTKKIKTLAASLAVSLGAGGLGTLLAGNSMKKYKDMYKPPLSPPGWVFPVAWTVLYVLMAVAAWRVYRADGPDGRAALKWYIAQLAVNAVWPLLYFRFQAYLLSLAWLVLLWYLVYETVKSFYRIDPTAGKMMTLYLAWVTFAGYLNLAVAIHEGI